MRIIFSVPFLLLAVAAPAGAAEPPGRLLPELDRLRRTEFAEMLVAILKGNPPVAGFGWFHPGQSAYGWQWLADRCDADGDGAVSRKEFPGPAELFERLDRDHDGRLTPEDFDWSPKSPLAREEQLAERLFRRGDADTNGRLSAAEWQAVFKQAARGKDHLTAEDLRALLFPPPPPPDKRGPPPDMPSRLTLLLGLLNGEIGSPGEGPKVGAMAPDFRLKQHDGDKEVSLSDYRGKKPVVLVFGSFT
jgi:hypothetical protein